MSETNYTRAALKAIEANILKKATPENQPTDGVLDAYLKLLERQDGAGFEAQIARLRSEVEDLRRGQATLPALSVEGSKLRQKLRAGLSS